MFGREVLPEFAERDEAAEPGQGERLAPVGRAGHGPPAALSGTGGGPRQLLVQGLHPPAGRRHRATPRIRQFVDTLRRGAGRGPPDTLLNS